MSHQQDDDSSQLRLGGGNSMRNTTDDVESDLASESGLEEGSEGGLEAGSSEGSDPSREVAEFGSGGDLWWNDFITAKEQMLQDVLQVTFKGSLPLLGCGQDLFMWLP